MAEGSGATGAPVNLMVNTIIEDSEQVRVTVPIDATVGEFVFRVASGMGKENPDAYSLYVPLAREGGEPEWHRLDDRETLLDAMRGVQRPPRIRNGGNNE